MLNYSLIHVLVVAFMVCGLPRNYDDMCPDAASAICIFLRNCDAIRTDLRYMLPAMFDNPYQ